MSYIVCSPFIYLQAFWNSVQLLSIVPIRLYYHSHYVDLSECRMMLRADDFWASAYWQSLKVIMFVNNMASTAGIWSVREINSPS